MSKDFLFPLRQMHGILHEWWIHQRRKCSLKHTYRKCYRQAKKRNPKTVFLVLTPCHSNLGDHAIALSETTLFREQGIDYIEITGKQLAEMQKLNCLGVMNGAPIIINGGGNLGTLWFDVEQLIRDTIKNNPRSHIFIMPSTIYYEDSNWGQLEFENSKSIYNSHPKLHIYARDPLSLQKMKDAYTSTELVPDMVLSLNWSSGETVRQGCLLCLRNDCEKLFTEQDKEQLFTIMRPVFADDIRYTDMHADHNVPVEERLQALNKKCAEFKQASLVITDRLHGMIFCAITGTPCIIINSRSPKIKGCYEWLRHLEYIKFCNSVPEVLDVYRSIPKKNYVYENGGMLQQHRTLISKIYDMI